MADDLNDEIKLGVDATGVETGVGRAKRAIDDLGKTVDKVGKTGGKGLTDVGSGAAKAGQEVDRATRSMVTSLQRQIAAAEAGGTATRAYQESLARLRGANMDVLKPYLDQLDQAREKTKDAAGATASLTQSFSGLKSAIVAVGAIGFAKHFIDSADAVTLLNNRLKLATGSASSAQAAYTSLYEIAQRSRVGFTQLGETYSSIARATGEMGISQQRMLKVTESIANAMTISGGSAQSMQAALVQLSQGMASGVLRGEELNSVMEQAPRLAKALADGLGVPIGKLREMGSAGEITSEQIVKALESQSAVLGKEVAGATLTVGQAFTQLSNASTNAIGEFDKASGASASLAGAISSVAGAMDTMGQAFKNNEAIINSVMGALTGAAALGTLAAIPRAIAAIGGAVTGLSAVLAANPVVLALLGVGAVVGAGVSLARAQARTVDGIRNSIEALKAENERSEAFLQRAMDTNHMGGADNIRKKIEERKKAIADLNAELASMDSKGLDTRAEDARLAAHTEQMAKSKRAQEELATIRQKLSGVDKDYIPTLTKLNSLREAGALSEKEYVAMVSQLATETWKSSAAGKEAAKNAAARASAAKAEQSTYEKLVASIKTKIDENAREFEFSSKLTDSDKLRIKLIAELDAGAKTLTASHKASALALLEKLAAQEKEKQSIKESIALYQEQVQNRKEQEAAEKGLFDRTNAMRQQSQEAGRALDEQEERMKLEISLIGQTSAVRDVALAKLQAEIDLRKELKEIDSSDVNEADREEARIKARERYARKIALAEKQVYVAEWEKTSKLIGDTLADYIMGGGKDAASYLKRLFATLVLRPVVEWGVSGLLGAAGLGGASGGSGILGAASSGMSAYNLFSNGGALGGLGSAIFGNSLVYGAAVPGLTMGGTQAAMLASQTGTFGYAGLSATASAGSGATGAGAASSAGWAALPVALAALGWFGSSYFDKGDTYSGAAYATSGGNDPLSVVRPGLTNYDPVTGDLPDRDALISQLTGLGANSSDLAGVNDRSLLHLLRLAENERRMERDGGPMMSWDTWIRDGSKDDFYRGPGYANPEAMGWWDNDPAGGYQGSMNYLLADPKIVEASRKLSEGILAPLDSISQALGLESDFRVTTGMARNDKTGNIFGGLAIQNNGQEVFNSGKQEFDSQGEYLRATFANTLSAFDSFDLPQWAQTQADDAKKKLDELKPGDTLGSDAATIYSQATSAIAATIGQISSLIKIVPELGGASQDAVYNIGQAMGTLDNFVSTYSGYVQNFYTEAERFDYIRAGINDTLSAFDISVTADTTREQFRALVEAQDLTTESGQKTFAALMQVSAAFAEITPVAEVVAQVFEEMAQSIGSDLTGVLTEGLLGNLTGADLGGQMADVVIGGVYNALAGNAASQISSIMTEGLITPLLRAATTGASISEAISSASIETMVANAQAAAQALGDVFNDPAFKDAMKSIDGAIRSITASMPSTPYYTAYQSQVKDYESAVKDSATEAERAAEAIRKSWSSISDSLLDEVRRIRGELADAGDQSMAYWQSQFAMDSAAARAGDEEAAKRLTGISGSLLDAAGREAASMLELQQMRAWVAQSLQDTAGYAAARGSGALTTTTPKAQMTVVPPLPVISQAPIVVSTNTDRLEAKIEELTVQNRNQAAVMADLQVQLLRFVRRWDAEGVPTVAVETV